MHEKPIALVRFSMNLYFCHAPVSVWNMLSILRFCLSRKTTMRLYDQAMTIPVHQRLSWKQHATTAVIGADNNHFITHVGTPHANKSGKVEYTKVYNTVNIWQRYSQPNIALYDEPNRQMFATVSEYNLDYVVHSIVFQQGHVDLWQNARWRHALYIKEQKLTFSDYPNNDEPVEPPHIQIHKPLLNTSTSSYKDVETFLNWIYKNLIKEQQYKLVVAFADEQLVAQIRQLISMRGNLWGDIIPFPGDLHFKMHVCLGVMRIGGEQYLLPIADYLGYKYIKVDFKLKEWSQHDDFLLLVAEGATEWLCGILGEKMKHLSFGDIVASMSHNHHVSMFVHI